MAAALGRHGGERIPLLRLGFITLPHAVDQDAGHHALLVRRNRNTGELAF
jgi:hypothetical protein